ncbi:MAG: prolipoprotein diacylglyceryl transferase [Alphaproteobacteria bacterium]|nr:prolipoprotein diacylglyceryl transferase [Alphaproteobacteria bacterium]
MVIPYPRIDPVLVHLGPLAIRWYAISYIVGILSGWWIIGRTLRDRSLWSNPPFDGKAPATADDIGDLVVWATLGIIIGGRVGWDLFYGTILCTVSPASFCGGLPYGFLTHPIKLVAVWEGGMSFHGGVLGLAIAIWLFCRRRKLNLFSIGDLVTSVAPLGIALVRMANFINGELWGRPTDVAWAMIFPRAPDRLPRHPSQLYECFLEGVVLFIIVQFCFRVLRWQQRPGLITGTFFTGYGLFRFFVEFFREPDAPFLGWFTMGMALCVPLILAGLIVYAIALARPPVSAAK